LEFFKPSKAGSGAGSKGLEAKEVVRPLFRRKRVHADLDRFQAKYVFGNSAYSQDQRNRDINDLMTSIRKVHAMAAVFPRAQAITDMIDATAAFKNTEKEVTSKDRLNKIGDAVEGLREQALILDGSVLE